MPVQREELRAVVRFVTQHDHRPVVLRLRVVAEGVDRPGQRREHRRAGVGEQIEPDVDGPVFVGQPWPVAKAGATYRNGSS